jgi:hypothetical protein
MAKIPPQTPPFNFPEPQEVVEGLKPFDLGAPPPELPQGSTNLPWFSELPETQTRDVDVMVEPNAVWLEQIRGYPEDQQALMKAWWSRAWNRPSQYLDGKVVLSLSGLLLHIEGAAKHEALERKSAQTQHGSEFAGDYIEWTKQCAARLAWIESKNEAWRDAVARAAEARMQWAAFIDAARKEYKAAKATPVPPRPKRV